MYGVLGVLIVVMAVSAAVNDRLPWSRRVGRFKIELLPISEEDHSSDTVRVANPSNVCDSGPWRQFYNTNLRDIESVILDKAENISLKKSPTPKYEIQDSEERPMKSTEKPYVPAALRRCVRTYGSWRALSSPVKSFINETFVKLHRGKRKKRRRKKARFVTDPELKTDDAISKQKLSKPSNKNARVRGLFARTNGSNCTCGPPSCETTKIEFILTPCECEADYEVIESTESNEVCEETVEEETSRDESLCEVCANAIEENTECETTCEEVQTTCIEVQTEQCCQLDPIPKHTTDESRARICQMTSPEDPQDDYPTYKTFPISGCRHKKRPVPRSEEHFETTVEKSYEPDLREIFSFLESTTTRSTTKKKNEKNSKIKFRRKYSKPKRKNRVSHFKRKDITTKNINTKTKPTESSKKYALENILSRIKGRANVKKSSTTEEFDNYTATENTMEVEEETEDIGCICSLENETMVEESGTSKKADLDEVFRKFLGEVGKENILTDLPSKDESVTLIINVEDEIIAPPAVNQNIPKTNPLSKAVEEMLAIVKSKMTEALGTSTESVTETGIITAERLKHVNHRLAATVDPILKRGLICTHCHKLNYLSTTEDEGELLNVTPEAKTVYKGTIRKKHSRSRSQEEEHTTEEESETVGQRKTRRKNAKSRCKDKPTTERESLSALIELYKTKSIPVTDADYDQIISRIRCNFTEDLRYTPTVDIFKQICEQRYGPITQSSLRSSSKQQKETTRDNEDYDIKFSFDTTATQKTHPTHHQSTNTQEDYEGSEEVQTTSSKKNQQTSQLTERSHSDEKTLVTMKSTHEVTSYWDNDQHFTSAKSTKHDEGTETIQTICFPASDFMEPDFTTILRTTIKASSSTPHKTEHEETTLSSEADGTTENLHDEEDQQSPSSKSTKKNKDTETLETICLPVRDFTVSEDTTILRKTIKASSSTPQQKETEEMTSISKSSGTTRPPKKKGKHFSPRPCNCPPQQSPSTHANVPHTYYHYSSSETSPKTPSYDEHHPFSSKYHPFTHPYITVLFSEEESEVTATTRMTSLKPKRTTSGNSKDNNLKPNREKIPKSQRFKFYPPLSLYRTWLSPWAAIQIKPRPSNNYKSAQLNYNYNDHNNGQNIISNPRQPVHPPVTAVSQPNFETTDSSIEELPSNIGKAKGVYVGAIVVGNEYLPAGFYKLEDLKKLKNSGISIPKFRGKKTIINKGVRYALKKISPHNHDKHVWKNNERNSRKGGYIYSMAKLPKGNIGRNIFEKILYDMMEDNSRSLGK